jgi:secreted trypsin-like serine protease
MKQTFLIHSLLAAAATSSLPFSIEASLWRSKSKDTAGHGDAREDRAPLPLPHSRTFGGQFTAERKQHAVKSSSVSPRIIGGEPVESGAFDFFADWHGCGGALIYEDIVVTAAHCGSFNDNQVYLNAIESPNEGRGLQEGPEQRTITARRTHPFYDPMSISNDIMLIKLDAPSTIQPLRINDDPTLPVDGEPLTVIGHGVTDPDNFFGSETLRQVTIPATSISQCANEYQDFFFSIDPDVHLCSGGEGDKGACFGDSGGES